WHLPANQYQTRGIGYYTNPPCFLSIMIQKYRQPYLIYLFAVAFLGMIPVIVGIVNLPNYTPITTFLLLSALAIVAQNVTTSVPIAGKAGITYAIGHTITLATVVVYGPAAAALIEGISSLAQWLIQRPDKTTWKRNWQQLGFNTGMFTISVYLAGWILIGLRNWLGAGTILGETIPWLISAFANIQINLFLLVAILYLQQKQEVNPFQLWRENLWASQINIMITAVGSAILAFAIMHYDWIAILVFFLPIVVSAYAFRLYVNQMKAHMDNLENIIDERTGKLKNLMKEKDAFLAVLTHDMKTPLTSIGIYGELIQKHPDLVIKKPHMANIITQSQRTLLDIVNNILDLEKLNVEGSLPMEIEDFDLGPIVEKVVETLRPQAMRKEISLKAHISSLPVIFQADRQQIERVLQNLISNAVKYTPHEGQVDVTLTNNEEFIFINVADTGYGIPEEELPYVFERFRRVAKHKNKATGTGLGLAITQQLVQANNGDITVASVEDEGTTFTVQFCHQANGSNKCMSKNSHVLAVA
ncbi:MAG: HAMP domain-containing histidine kinase, partial [Chloroflexi bacterium]|nr:HAMP domain-containing histidine kinase [Chloroflexota bacterium]